jgi:hypothetical protein
MWELKLLIKFWYTENFFPLDFSFFIESPTENTFSYSTRKNTTDSLFVLIY